MSNSVPITKASLFTYQLPFRRPLTFNDQKLTQRDGLILQLENRLGQKSFGEIAPLPGFSKETLTQARLQIVRILESGLTSLNSQMKLFPSVQFALDNALGGSPLSAHLPCTDLVPLIQGESGSVTKQYVALQKPAIIKLKVARQSVKQDIALFNQLTTLHPLLKIRCDANQAWTAEQADLFFSKINKAQLDYIEEPTASLSENLQLAEKQQIYLGLDETLQQPDFHYQHSPQIRALVLKPTLIGSLNRVENYIELGKHHQLQISISSSFESLLGLLQLNHLANQHKDSGNISLGIDTLKYFQSGLLTDPTRIRKDIQALECIWKSN